MPYEFYKIIHFTGLVITFSSLFSLLIFCIEPTASCFSQDLQKKLKKLGSIFQGVGLLLVVISGFGLAARLGYFSQLPNWIYFKICFWLILGGIPVVIKRKLLPISALYILIISVAILGATVAVTKPF